MVVAAALRLHGIDWDSGFGFHPDERSFYLRADCMYDVLTNASGHARCLFEYPSTEPGIPSIGVFLDPERSPLNPHWFPLGSVLIYVLVGIRWVIELFADVSAMDLRFAGRALAAMADVGSVFVVYLLGARMFNRRVGLLAAGLTALAVVHVQTSHFYRPEPFSLVFTLLSFWAMERMVRCRRWRDSLVLGLLVGLAMAPKVSVLPLVVPLGVAFFYWAWLESERRWAGFTPLILARMVVHATLAGVCAVAVFFVLTPYALLDFPAFVADLAAQANMAREAGLWPFTIQYVDTPPFLYQLRQTIVWGLGIPLGIVAWSSVPFAAVIIWRGGPTRRQDLLLLAWVVPQFIFLETFEVRFMRYLFPLMPFIILLGARLMVALVDNSPVLGFRIGQGVINRTTLPPHLAEIVRKGLPRVAVALVALVVLTTAFYSLAFQRVYARPHPAVAASDWINENVPVGRKIISDNHWDEFVPRLHRYDLWQFEAYEPDGAAKMSDLAARLAASDYLVFYSQRPFVSVGRASERFPLSADYYRQLFSGDLGYRLERTFTSHPALWGVTFQDSPYAHAGLAPPAPPKAQSPPTIGLGLGYADENVVGYDHPQVLLFKNVEQLPRPVLVARLVGGIYPGKGGGGGLMLSEPDKAKQRAGGTWSELFRRNSWTNKVPLIAWLLVTETFFVLALPFSILMFRFLPDRGIVLARLLGFLVAGYVTWLLVSLGWFEFSKTPIILGLLVLASLSLTALLFQWRETRDFLFRNWRILALGEAIFLGAFLAFALVRAANPDLWHPFRGGEKPMELAYLTAVIRSTTFPPYDPWFSGGHLNYYYWGYYLLSLPTRLTGIVPTTVFNLAVPWFFALTFTAAYSLVYNLASGVNSVREGRFGATPNGRTRSRMAGPRERQGRQPGSLWSRALASPVSAGLLGGSLVAVVGNLDGLVQLVRSAIGWAMNGGSGWMAFDYWRSSRMIPPLDNVLKSPLTWWLPEGTPGFVEQSFHITEFPFFTFLFADLHAHMMVIPFTLLAIGLGVNFVLGFRAAGWGWVITAAGLLGLGLGAIWALNSWDYPAYLILTVGLVGLAVILSPYSRTAKLGLGLLLASSVVLVSFFAFQPFHANNETFDASIEVTKWRIPVTNYLAIHGLFLFIVGTFLVTQCHRVLQPLRQNFFPNLQPGEPPDRRTWGLIGLGTAAGLILALAGALYLAAAGYWNAALLVLVIALVLLILADTLACREPGYEFVVVALALLGLAFSIGVGVDLVHISGDIGRMNTLFKLYLEAWVLLALSSAFLLWYAGTRGSLASRWRWVGPVWITALLLITAGSLVYPVLGTKGRLADRFGPTPLTFDGTAFMADSVHVEGERRILLRNELAGIQWLQDNVQGSPVVLEAHYLQYHWASRISSYTGLPTVLGWPWHQIQQRQAYAAGVGTRARHVKEIYETSDVRRAVKLLETYEVSYVVVGGPERAYYTAEGLDKFPQMVAAGRAELVFTNPDLQIYRIL